MAYHSDVWEYLDSHFGSYRPDADGRLMVETRPCYKCRYFEPISESGDLALTGLCNRYPPVFTGLDKDDTTLWDVPEVGGLSSCGEWKERD